MIEVLLFAQLQEDAGTDKITVDIVGTTVREMREKLAADYGLQQINEAMIAINEAYALDEDTIREGDTVAIIPPVSGG